MLRALRRAIATAFVLAAGVPVTLALTASPAQADTKGVATTIVPVGGSE
jgi:hypothetical protein